MTYIILILLAMIFCHIVDDYYLQGILASMKQKSWWEQNHPEPMYQYDYMVALIVHSFSWAFSIMFVPTIYLIFIGGVWNPFLFLGNIVIHAYVDDLKANKKKINLVQDQSVHLIQILVTWFLMLIV